MLNDLKRSLHDLRAPGQIRVEHLEGQLEQDAAGQAPERYVLGQDHVGVAQDEHHALLVGRVLHDADLIRHYRRPVVPRRHLSWAGCCTTHNNEAQLKESPSQRWSQCIPYPTCAGSC